MVGIHFTQKNNEDVFNILFSKSVSSRYGKFISIDVLLSPYSMDEKNHKEMYAKFRSIEYTYIPDERLAVEYDLKECMENKEVFSYSTPMLIYLVPNNENDKTFCNRKWELAIFDYEHQFVEMFGEVEIIESILVELKVEDVDFITYPGNIRSGISIKV